VSRCELSGVLDGVVVCVAGNSSSQHSAVGICNHRPSKSSTDRSSSGGGSKVGAQAEYVYGRARGRLRWEIWRAGIGSFFVGT